MKECIMARKKVVGDGNILMLYDGGNEFTSVTGGYGSRVISGSVAITKSASSLIVQPTASYSEGLFYTNNLINLEPYDKLKMNYTLTSISGGWGALSVDTVKDDTAHPGNGNLAGVIPPVSAVFVESEVDISAINTLAYVKLGAAVGGTAPNHTITVTKIWLEKE